MALWWMRQHSFAVASLLANWCVWSSALVQEEDLSLICSSHSQSCGSEVCRRASYALEFPAVPSFTISTKIALSVSPKTAYITFPLEESFLNSLHGEFVRFQSTECPFRLVQSSAVMSHTQSQIVKGIHPNMSHIEPATQQQFVSRNLPFKRQPS
jgi:hypothetical protein